MALNILVVDDSITVRAVIGRTLEIAEQAADDEPEFLRGGAYGETAAFLDALVRGEPLPSPSPRDVLPASALAAELATEA